MPVHDRGYHGYAGPRRTGGNWRILARQSVAGIFSSRLSLLLFILAWIPVLVFASLIYIRGNMDLFASLGMTQGKDFPQVGGVFFFWFLFVQSGFGLLFAAFVGPGIVAPDLAHNALPLYFSRPLSRADYILGKGAALAYLLSLITTLPGTILWILQATLAGGEWAASNLRALLAVVAGASIWVAVVTLLSLAISAWVRWRPIATAALFLLLVAGTTMGKIVSLLLQTRYGDLLSINVLMQSVWAALFGATPLGAQFKLPAAPAAIALALLAAASLALLRRKLAAVEVSR